MSSKIEYHIHPILAWVVGITAPIFILLVINDFSILGRYYVNTTKLWIYFPISQAAFCGVIYLLIKLQETGAKILLAELPDQERADAYGFWGDGVGVASLGLAAVIMPIAGIFVGAFFAYDGHHFLITLLLGIFGGYAAHIAYFPAFIVFHCLIFGVVTFYVTHLFAGLHYAFVPHPATKNVAPAKKRRFLQKPIDEEALADTLEDQEVPSTRVGMALRAFKADKIAKTLRAKAKMNRADAGVADATTEYERARRHLKDAKKHAEQVRDYTED